MLQTGLHFRKGFRSMLYAEEIENRDKRFNKLGHGNKNKKCENLLLGLIMHSI